MTVWDYSTDIEVVLVNLDWWNNLAGNQQILIREVADSSISYQTELLKKNTEELRAKIAEEGMQIYYLTPEEKTTFRKAVKPVWEKYEKMFTTSYLEAFLEEIEKY
jgi:TRAP-type C4-dicarboxylate transport system substrate-binding protein